VYEATVGRAWRPTNPSQLAEYLVRYRPDELKVYREIQSQKSARQANTRFFSDENLAALGREIVAIVPSPLFGICHGAKSGAECVALAGATGAEVIGTDISEHVRDLPGMVVWDFHELNPDWVDRADFIYSNSWDHCHDPDRAFAAWARSLRPGGVVVFDHSPLHSPGGQTPADPYGATREALQKRVLAAARGTLEFVAEVRLPDRRGDHALIFRRVLAN
jgi:SAM-dependent methyltransferase